MRSDDPEMVDDDNLTATVSFADGSVLTLLYTTGGPKNFPKEQFEVFAPGLVVQLTDYRRLWWQGRTTDQEGARTEDKGQAAEMTAWAEYLTGAGSDVADFRAAAMSTWLTLRALEAARTGATLPVASTLNDVIGS